MGSVARDSRPLRRQQPFALQLARHMRLVRNTITTKFICETSCRQRLSYVAVCRFLIFEVVIFRHSERKDVCHVFTHCGRD